MNRLLAAGLTLALAVVPVRAAPQATPRGDRAVPVDRLPGPACPSVDPRRCAALGRAPAEGRTGGPDVANASRGASPAGRGTGAAPAYVEPSSVPANSFAGMVADGSAITTAVLQRALAYAASLHLPLRLCGTYKIDAALTLYTPDGVANTSSGIIGCSVDGAVLQMTNPTQDGIVFSAARFGMMYGCRVENLTIGATATKMSGTGVKITFGQRCSVSRVKQSGYYHGIDLHSTALTTVAYNDFLVGTPAATRSGSQAIGLYGNDVNSYILYNYADNAYSGNIADMPSIGIGIYNLTNGDYIEDNSMSKFQYGLLVSVGSGEKVQNLFLRQNAFDICGINGALFRTLSGRSGKTFNADITGIYRIFSLNDWFAATQKGAGLRFAGDAPMGNIQLDSPQIRSNYSNGLELAGNVSGMTVSDIVATANNDGASPNHSRAGTTAAGVAIADPRVSHVTFVGGRVGPTAEEYSFQSYGFTIVAGVDYVSIEGVDVTGNKAGSIANSGGGRHNRFEGNMGYNPVGGGLVTVGASPWTYIAGPSPETLYVYAGTCSRVAQNQVDVNRTCATLGTYQLGPNETLQVTYSAAPIVSRIVH